MHFKWVILSLWRVSVELLSLGWTFELIAHVGRVLFSLQRGGGLRFIALRCAFLSHLVLSLNVILSQVAVLAHTRGVVRPVGMATNRSHLGLALPVVAVVAHILGVVLPVGVRALVDQPSLSLVKVFSCRSFMILGVCIRNWALLAIEGAQLIDWFLNVELHGLGIVLMSLAQLAHDVVDKGGVHGLLIGRLKRLLLFYSF